MNKKNLFVKFLSISLLFTFSSVSFANENVENHVEDKVNQQQLAKKTEMLEIMEQLNEHRATELLQESKQSEKASAFSITEQKIDDVELNLQEKLKTLGAIELSTEEVKQRFSNSDTITPFVALPPTTSAIKWYIIDYEVTKNQVTYKLQDLYAQGLAAGSNLAKGADGAKLYTNKQIVVDGLQNIASMYAQKVVGLVPIVTWLPYELLFAQSTNVTNNSHTVTHRSLSTVAFTYVKKSGQSDSSQSLSYISNMISIASTHTLAGFKDGSPYTKSSDTINTSYASDYASGSKAVDSYLNTSTQRTSFISSYSFYNHDRTASLTYYPVIPSYPAQIGKTFDSSRPFK